MVYFVSSGGKQAFLTFLVLFFEYSFLWCLISLLGAFYHGFADPVFLGQLNWIVVFTDHLHLGLSCDGSVRDFPSCSSFISLFKIVYYLWFSALLFCFLVHLCVVGFSNPFYLIVLRLCRPVLLECDGSHLSTRWTIFGVRHFFACFANFFIPSASFFHYCCRLPFLLVIYSVFFFIASLGAAAVLESTGYRYRKSA